MFNKLFFNLGDISTFHDVISTLETLIVDIISNVKQGEGAKDAAIDAICEILQSHKSSNKIENNK